MWNKNQSKTKKQIFLSPLSLQRTKRNSAAQFLTSVSISVIRRTILFLSALPTSGLFITSRRGGSTLTKHKYVKNSSHQTVLMNHAFASAHYWLLIWGTSWSLDGFLHSQSASLMMEGESLSAYVPGRQTSKLLSVRNTTILNKAVSSVSPMSCQLFDARITHF